MNYTIEMSPKAEKELNEAWEWYEEEQPGLGERFEKEFFRKIGLIVNNPLHYPLKKGSREVRTDSFPYLLIYKVSKKKNTIVIVSVFHTSRHPKKKR
ncbi:MAG TPA: type II toxin-antitoxin system RelE/ParE family toxin [Mucilaginibacter sp.]